MILVSLPKEDWDLIIEAIDYRLYVLDQENHFFQEEPGSTYHELIEIRDYILSFTTSVESIE
jgi:hypothetical protein